jgi:hypothetical protein
MNTRNNLQSFEENFYMKKVVLASLLATVCALPLASVVRAQAPAAGQVQMSADEYTAYNNANTQTDPAAKAKAFQAYLKAYPNSTVKQDVLTQIVFLYSQTTDEAATLAAADDLLAVDPGNLRALALKVYYLRADGDKATDPAVKQTDLDKAAGYAQQGLSATSSKGVPPAEFTKFKAATMPTFESAIADDDLAKKDNAGAITALTTELNGVPVADTQDPQKQLQDVYVLAQAYYTATPPDYLNCAWYATRAANFAPAAFKPTIQTLATYCYKKFHGGTDGYDAIQTAVATNLNPPAGLLAGIKPAPKPEDMVHSLVSTTPDLATLALGDKETALQYGTKEDADKVFDSVKGKAVEFPGVTVVSATADQLVLMVSDDANTSKTPDFTVMMKEPLKTIPAAGDKITVDGTYASYTASPLMITMSDGSVVEPKKAPAKAPVRRRPAR